jgi:uncharacterized protein with ATP-grasp and redox domains
MEAGLMLRIKPECIPCNISIIIRASRYATSDPDKQREILRRALNRLTNLTWEENPMDISADLQEIVEELTGVSDPYWEIKRISNETALKYIPKAREMIKESNDPLKVAAKLAIAGNILDFGAYSDVAHERPILMTEKMKLSIDDYKIFSDKVLSAKKLLFVFDNAGEVVFDKLLIETMIEVRGKPFEKITLVGREKPLINDVTFDDLRGLEFNNLPNSVIKSIGCGRRAKFHAKSLEVNELFDDHDLIILKGQGNFEMFQDRSNVFFLLVVKCAVVAEALSVDQGSLVLKYSL